MALPEIRLCRPPHVTAGLDQVLARGAEADRRLGYTSNGDIKSGVERTADNSAEPA